MFTTKIIRHYFRLTIHCYESQWWTDCKAQWGQSYSCKPIILCAEETYSCLVWKLEKRHWFYKILFSDKFLSQWKIFLPRFQTWSWLNYNCYRVVWIKVNKVTFFLWSELQILTFALKSLNWEFITCPRSLIMQNSTVTFYFKAIIWDHWNICRAILFTLIKSILHNEVRFRVSKP